MIRHMIPEVVMFFLIGLILYLAFTGQFTVSA